MKLTANIAVIILSITASVLNAQDGQSPVETFYQNVDIQRSPSFSTGLMNVKQQIHYQLQSLFEVYPEDERGNRKVTQVVSDTRLLKADPLSQAVFTQSLADMKGQKFTYTINKFSEVVSMEGHEDKTKLVDVQQPKSKGVLVSSVIDEDGWKELAQLTLFQPPPDRRRARSFVRKTTHDWGNLGRWYGNTDFRQTGSRGSRKQYGYQHKLEYIPPDKDAAAAGDLPFDVQKADFHAYQAQGTIQFNEKQNRVEMVREVFHARGNVATEMLGIASEVTVEEKQLFTITVTGQQTIKVDQPESASKQRLAE